MYEEVVRGEEDDRLVLWIEEHKDDLVLADEASPKSVREVTSRGYAPDFTEVEVVKTGRDPFLIAYAFDEPERWCLVTEEVSRPTATRGNRKIPDVCFRLDRPCCDTVELIRRLDFRTRKSGTGSPVVRRADYRWVRCGAAGTKCAGFFAVRGKRGRGSRSGVRSPPIRRTGGETAGAAFRTVTGSR